MNPSDAIEAIEKPLSSLPYSLSRHILEHLRKLTSHEPVIGIMGKSGAVDWPPESPDNQYHLFK
ncbi:histone [Escherichia coli]|nr:histone [Escherichia coli]GHL03160.1 hypothetical protein ECZU21_21730 [Escherichia coli]GHL39751.1 hypothetical protein ECZU27_49170 [Escherichia coli]GHL72042.1 hypothetical protein ECZU33_46020 [Escherichia coli]